jgi:hypothetical protein
MTVEAKAEQASIKEMEEAGKLTCSPYTND